MNKINYSLYLLKLPIIKRIVPSILRLFNLKMKFKILNFKLYLNLASSIDREIYLKKEYEKEQILFLKKNIEKNNFEYFFDIGSYLGYYALFIENNTNIKNIIAFEPNETNFFYLKRNIEINNSKIKIYNEGCSNKNSKSKIWYTNKNKTGGSSIYYPDDNELKKYNQNNIFFKKINLIKLDDKFSVKDSLVVAKIDTERHEINVLKGGINLFSNNKTFLQIEIFSEHKDNVFKYLKSNGFSFLHSIKNDFFFKNFLN